MISRIMTSRTVITISQRKFLVRKFEEGMHSCGQNTLNARQAAATVTGLTLNTINVRLTCQHWYQDDVFSKIESGRAICDMLYSQYDIVRLVTVCTLLVG